MTRIHLTDDGELTLCGRPIQEQGPWKSTNDDFHHDKVCLVCRSRKTPSENEKVAAETSIVYGTCQYGHKSKPLLVKRLADNAAMVRCTATSKSSKKPCSDVYVMFDYRQEPKEASYDSVQAKAVRLRNQGKVAILRIDWDIVAARVLGDSGITYEVELDRQDPTSEAVSQWSCDCKWAQYAWGRTRQWTKFEGRMCAHALATLFEVQSRENRKQSPDFRWKNVEARTAGKLYHVAPVRQVEDAHYYTFEEMTEKALTTEEYGPWE